MEVSWRSVKIVVMNATVTKVIVTSVLMMFVPGVIVKMIQLIDMFQIRLQREINVNYYRYS